MQKGTTLSVLATALGAIGLSLVGNSPAQTAGVRMEQGPKPLSLVKLQQENPPASPGSGQARSQPKPAPSASRTPIKRLAIDPSLKFVSTFGIADTVNQPK